MGFFSIEVCCISGRPAHSFSPTHSPVHTTSRQVTRGNSTIAAVMLQGQELRAYLPESVHTHWFPPSFLAKYHVVMQPEPLENYITLLFVLRLKQQNANNYDGRQIKILPYLKFLTLPGLLPLD